MFSVLDYSFLSSDPDHPEVSPLPKWTYTAAAIFLFLAYTLGKNCLRTFTFNYTQNI